MIPKSLNLNLRGLPQSATLTVNRRSLDLLAAGRPVTRFGLGQSPFPVPEPVVQALRDHAHEKDYLPVEGLPALREAVAAFHRERDGAEVRADGVLVGPGSKELMFLMQLASYADLLVPTPCWVSYGPQARILGRGVRLLSTTFEERWRLSAERLAEVCADDPERPRILILNSPGNPDGDTYDDAEAQAIAEVARRHGIIVLSDEIYGLTHHRGAHRSIARYYPEGTVISGGLSKWCGAGGWRLGTMAFPAQLEWLQRAMAAAASETYTSVSAPIQHAAVRAFEGGAEIEAYLDRCRRVLRGLSEAICDRLLAAGVRLHRPQGAFYLWLDLSSHRDGLAARGLRTGADVCEALLSDTGVAILPGVSFERPDDELTARLAYVDFDGAAALAELAAAPLADELPAGFLERRCPRVLGGIEALCEWLQAPADS